MGKRRRALGATKPLSFGERFFWLCVSPATVLILPAKREETMSARLPETGRSWDEIEADMLARGASDAKWRDGKTAV